MCIAIGVEMSLANKKSHQKPKLLSVASLLIQKLKQENVWFVLKNPRKESFLLNLTRN